MAFRVVLAASLPWLLLHCAASSGTSGGSLAALGQDTGDACSASGGCEASGHSQGVASAVHLLQQKAGHRLKAAVTAEPGQVEQHQKEEPQALVQDKEQQQQEGQQGLGLKVYAAGANDYGQLGLGYFSPSENFPTPQLVAGLEGLIVVEVDTCDAASYFRTATGCVHAVGRNDYGQLGQGDTLNRSLPVKIRGLPPVKQLAAGDDHVMFLTETGQVWGCGENENPDGCQLGRPADSGNRLEVAKVKGLDGIALSSAGEDFSVHVNFLGRVISLGENDVGQLGLGFRSGQECTPGTVPELCTAIQVAAGEDHALMLDGLGRVFSWGRNHEGQLANGTIGGDRSTPFVVTRLESYRITSIAAGSHSSYFLTAEGNVFAAGRNSYGELGLGDDSPSQVTEPMMVPALPPVWKIVAGDRRAFFLTLDGRALATGRNSDGQLGVGDTRQRNTPTAVTLYGVADVGAAVDDNYHTVFLAAGTS